MPGNAWAPCLAESWTQSKDGLTYEFVLRKGVRFHNGDPLTAEDVKFSFERYKGAGATTLKARVAAVEIVDPQRVRFRLKQPWPDFMTFYATPASGAAWIVPKAYTERVGDDGFKRAPVGAGPYRFVSFSPGVELVVEAYDGYWRKTPAVKRLVFKSVPDESTRLAMLKRARGRRRLRAARPARRGGAADAGPHPEGRPTRPSRSGSCSPSSGTRSRRGPTSACGSRPTSPSTARRSARRSISGYGKAGAEHHSPRLRVLLGAARVSVRPGAGQAAPGRGRLPEGLRRRRGRDRRGLRARRPRPSSTGLQAIGIRARLRPMERAGLLQGGPGQAVQAPGPRRQRRRRQRGDADRGVRDLERDPLVRRLPGHRRALPRPGGRDGHASAARRCSTRSSSSCTSARCSRRSWSRRC